MKDENEEIDDVKLRNDPNEAEVDNLINLPYLHEPAILYCLERRYNISDIYTYTGPILIAVNPFKRVQLYTNQILEMYYNMGLLKSQGIESSNPLPPHVYAIADAAYRAMMTVILNSSHSGAGGLAPADQAILISGESGAGKTESTKIVLRYLTTVGSSSGGVEIQTGSIMDKVLNSNPILEAFGNAKTLRNNNSSRFGKFMNLSFESNGVIVGCGTTNYLLEKSRVHKQAENERSYHIFYQICSAVDDLISSNSTGNVEITTQEHRKSLYEDDSPTRLSQRGDLTFLSLTGNPEDYHYLIQSGCTTIPNISDLEQFNATETACIKLGLTKKEINDIYGVCAAILHLGNIQFQDKSNTTSGGCDIIKTPSSLEALNNASKLMGLSPEEISLRLRTRELVLRGEVNSIQNTTKQAIEARDALCKMMYKRCFDWLIERTNLAMIDQQDQQQQELQKYQNGGYNDVYYGKKASIPQRRYIGILDIFGFEIFETNGFEQVILYYFYYYYHLIIILIIIIIIIQ